MRNYIFELDLLSTFFFSVSGTMIGRRQGTLDFYGVGLVALLTAVGGGTVRDIMLDAHPLAWISRAEYIVAIILGIACTYLFLPIKTRKSTLFVMVDALAVSFAAFAGLEKSLHLGANPFAAIFLGGVTATFGGIIRDVVCNKIPQILYTEVYASVILAGCAINWSVKALMPGWNAVANILGYGIIIGLRLISVQKGWSLSGVSGWVKSKLIGNGFHRQGG